MVIRVQALEVRDGVTIVYAHTNFEQPGTAYFRYEGGVNADLVEALAGRKEAFFEAEVTWDGLVIGDEVPRSSFGPMPAEAAPEETRGPR